MLTMKTKTRHPLRPRQTRHRRFMRRTTPPPQDITPPEPTPAFRLPPSDFLMLCCYPGMEETALQRTQEYPTAV